MELIEYWKIVRKSLWLILLFMVVSVGLAVGYTVRQPVMYDSSATLLLNPAVPNSLVPYIKTELAPNIADSYTALIHTETFAGSVTKELPFKASPSEVIDALSTELVPNTLFYKITARMDTPDKAEQLVQSVVKVFLSANAAQQAEANKNATSATEQVRSRLEDKVTLLGEQIKSYETRITELESQPPSNTRDDQLIQLRGQLVSLQQSETEAMVAMAQLGDGSTQENTALVIDQPRLGSREPDRMVMNVGLAFAAALVLGIALAFFLNSLDYSVQSAQHIEAILGTTPAALVGVANGTDKNRSPLSPLRWIEAAGHLPFVAARRNVPPSTPEVVTLSAPDSPQTESLRALRTNIQFSSVDKPIRSLVVTSCGAGEGKTFTSVNLAVVMAQAGRRVILVDADLRSPHVHKTLGLHNSTGFTSLIYDKTITFAQTVQPVARVKNLAVISAGILPSNPSELLNTQQCARIMSQLAQQADMVIYDSPPAGLVTDAIVLGARTDGVVLVVNAGKTRRDMLAHVWQSLRNVGVDTVLPVLNRVSDGGARGKYINRYYRSDAHGVDRSPLEDRPASANGALPHNSPGKEIPLPVD